MMKEGEYDGNIAYLCTKMEQWDPLKLL
jgi:hypothetical protein